jgi:hypothetical protein
MNRQSSLTSKGLCKTGRPVSARKRKVFGWLRRPGQHWRVAFRRRYFTSRTALQRSLDTFLRFYNHERPHHGYRLRGQTPAALFWGAANA